MPEDLEWQEGEIKERPEKRYICVLDVVIVSQLYLCIKSTATLQIFIVYVIFIKVFLKNRGQMKNNKIIDLNSLIPIITLNINGLNKTQLCAV